MQVYTENAKWVEISLVALLGTLNCQYDKMTQDFSSFYKIEEDKSKTIKAALLKKNTGTLSEEYFHISKDEANPLELQRRDAWEFAFNVFGAKPPPMTEDQVLETEVARTFSNRVNVPQYGRHVGTMGGKTLWLHLVHRDKIETCLGVDLIYNFVTEQRLIFVQYKLVTEKVNGYYHNNQGHNAELARMKEIHGVTDCRNFQSMRSDFRACSCPVFFKLCERRVKKRRITPNGIYFPVCMWDGICNQQSKISLSDNPHFTTGEFVRFVRCGMVGSTPTQSDQILAKLESDLPQEHKILTMLFSEISPTLNNAPKNRTK